MSAPSDSNAALEAIVTLTEKLTALWWVLPRLASSAALAAIWPWLASEASKAGRGRAIEVITSPKCRPAGRRTP